MSRRCLRRIPALPALCAVAVSLTALTGCSGRKVVARVNSAAITEDDYFNRVQYIRANNFTQSANLDAGGVTLISMIQDSLTEQLAKEKKVEPSEEQIKQLTQVVRRMTPPIEQQILAHQMSEEDLYRQVRHLLELTALGTEGAKADSNEVQKMYDEMKKEPIYPATYTIRALVSPDLSKLNDVLPQLKATGNFKEAAKAMKLPAAQLATAGNELILTKKEAPPELVKALDELGNGPFTPEKGVFTKEPVAISSPPNPANPTAPTRTIFVFAQLIGKQSEETPPLDKIRPYLEIQALEHAQPQWQLHAQQKIGEYTRTAQIQINIDRYKPLLDSIILAQANAHAEPAPPMEGGPGEPPTGAAPPVPGPGSSTPGGAPSTPNGANAPTPGSPPGSAPAPGGAAPGSNPGGAPSSSGPAPTPSEGGSAPGNGKTTTPPPSGGASGAPK